MRILSKSRAIKSETEIPEEATELLFEAQDVADLVAEVTGEDVEVAADEESATFTVGDTDYTVEAEGTEEIVAEARRVSRGSRSVNSSRRPAGRTIRQVRNRK